MAVVQAWIHICKAQKFSTNHSFLHLHFFLVDSIIANENDYYETRGFKEEINNDQLE